MLRYPRQNSVYYLTAAAFFLFALLHGRYFKGAPENPAPIYEKEIKAFYLPADILMQLKAGAPSLRRISVEGGDYFRLDLGDGGTPVPYGYNCFLTISEEHELEMIRLKRT